MPKNRLNIEKYPFERTEIGIVEINAKKLTATHFLKSFLNFSELTYITTYVATKV